MLLSYLPLIILSQLLLFSLLLNVFLFRQNRKLTRINKAVEQASKERLFIGYVENTNPHLAEDQTLFIHQPIFKAESSDSPTPIVELSSGMHSAAALPIEMPAPMTEKSSVKESVSAENTAIELPFVPLPSSTIENKIINQPEKKSTFDDINRLLNEISQIEHKMGLKDKTGEA